MKVKEKQQARELRQQGWSINQIYKEIGVGKGSVSLWVRDIELTGEQKQELSERGHKKEAIEKRRQARLSNEQARRQTIIDTAEQEFEANKQNTLYTTALALYWGEGGKTRRGIVRLSNSDPALIKVFIRFLREFCQVPKEKFRGHIHIHPHLDAAIAKEYWSGVSAIPQGQFFKTYQKPNKASQNKRDTLPYGTFSVYVCDTELFLKIQGWTQGLVKEMQG